MEKINKIKIRLLILWFTISVSTAIVPTESINTYGLLGEIRTTTVTREQQVSMAQMSTVLKQVCSVKGIAIYNVWFILLIIVTFLIYACYKGRFLEEETIISLKVRMDD